MVLQSHFYLAPLVANLRNTEGFKLGTDSRGRLCAFFALAHILWIVDGQHRREAVRMVREFLKDIIDSRKYKKHSLYPATVGQEVTLEELQVWELIREAVNTCNVAVEVNLGLNAEQEQQVFYDLNNKGKPINQALALSYDRANPVNVFSNNLEEKVPGISDRLGRKELVGINSILLLNKTSIKGADYDKVESRRIDADHFWREVIQIPGFMEGDKKQTVAWQPVVIKALAKLAFDLSKNENEKEHNALIGAIRNGKLGLTNENPMWRWFRMTEEERNAPEFSGLRDYLPPASKITREIGAHDSEG